MSGTRRKAAALTAAALRELHQKIDRSYMIEEGTAVLGLVRFLAEIVPKCFT